MTGWQNDCGFRIHILPHFFITWEEKMKNLDCCTACYKHNRRNIFPIVFLYCFKYVFIVLMPDAVTLQNKVLVVCQHKMTVCCTSDARLDLHIDVVTGPLSLLTL